MKKILSFLAISALLSTSTINLISCSCRADPVGPIKPIDSSREFGVDYTFTNTDTWSGDTSYAVSYNTASLKGLYLEDGDIIEMTWNWNGRVAKTYSCVISLGAELTPDASTPTWKLILNKNYFYISHLMADVNQCTIKIMDPSTSIREYGKDYIFPIKINLSFGSNLDFTIYYNTAYLKGLYLEDGDQIQMTWDWDSGASTKYFYIVSLGTELTPEATSPTWKLTLNQDNFSVSHLKAVANQCRIKVVRP